MYRSINFVGVILIGTHGLKIFYHFSIRSVGELSNTIISETKRQRL
jgi:hypothetical protein